MLQMNVLFFSIFCRFQNCVYTYRILPNEDKKLSVQVKNFPNLYMVVVTDLW